MSAKNPAKQQQVEHVEPAVILEQLRANGHEVASLLDEIESLIVED